MALRALARCRGLGRAMALKAAIFDVFGTVVDWRRGVAEAAAPVLAAVAPGIDPLDFADAWRAEYQPGMERVRSGARAYQPLEVLHLENLDRVLARFGLQDAVDMPMRHMLNTAWERLPPWPDAVAGLRAMRPGLILAPCSNGSIAMMVRLARHGGLPWDCVLGADIARAYKPDPAVYRRSVEALGLAPAEVAMVAAHGDDLVAAREAGLATAFVPRPAEHGPDRPPDPGIEGGWEFSAADFRVLAGMLAG